MIVLDTNVVSELMRPSPDRRVARWADQQVPAQVVTTAVTVAEMSYGIARLPAGQRRDVLALTAAQVFDAFADRLLPFDALAAAQYAAVVVERETAGRPIRGFDAQIAAICHRHRARLVTRNTVNFAALALTSSIPGADPRPGIVP